MGLFSRKKAAPPRVGLALGGGGARGFIEIGALKAFSDLGIRFDVCVGTSVGSIVGALYAAGVDIDEIIEVAEALEMSDLHGKLLIKPDDPKKIGAIVYKIIGDAKIENLPIPYAAVATDLKTGKQIVLDKGSVIDAVSASSAYPIVYSPLTVNGMNLSDGGLVNNLPVDVCRMLGAEKVVAVDLANKMRGSGTDGTGIIDMIKAVFSIMSNNASVMGRTRADVLISPDTTPYSAASKGKFREMIELGYSAAKEKGEEIKALFAPVKK
ncbi:MAG: patatin-like phospholipase family protein [Clostridiales bacterium]|nr:patatin-like phospholipase family protein [Clostridiales bacterium]